MTTLTQQLARLNSFVRTGHVSSSEAVALANTLHALLVEAEGALAKVARTEIRDDLNYYNARAFIEHCRDAQAKLHAAGINQGEANGK